MNAFCTVSFSLLSPSFAFFFCGAVLGVQLSNFFPFATSLHWWLVWHSCSTTNWCITANQELLKCIHRLSAFKKVVEMQITQREYVKSCPHLYITLLCQTYQLLRFWQHSQCIRYELVHHSPPQQQLETQWHSLLQYMDTGCSSGQYTKQKPMKEQTVDDTVHIHVLANSNRKPWEVLNLWKYSTCSYLIPT